MEMLQQQGERIPVEQLQMEIFNQLSKWLFERGMPAHTKLHCSHLLYKQHYNC
jgi:hypothetical protein